MNIRPRSSYNMPGPLGPPMQLPAQRLIVHHSVTAAHNGPHAIEYIAGIGVSRFGRASYSYAVSPDGTVWEMQADRVGAHTLNRNSSSFGVVAAGNYDVIAPYGRQLESIADLYVWLAARGWLVEGAPIRGHRDYRRTACPGSRLYGALPVIRRLTRTEPDDEPEEEEIVAVDVVQVDGDVWLIDHPFRERVPDGAGEYYVNLAKSSANRQYAGPYDWSRDRLERHPLLPRPHTSVSVDKDALAVKVVDELVKRLAG